MRKISWDSWFKQQTKQGIWSNTQQQQQQIAQEVQIWSQHYNHHNVLEACGLMKTLLHQFS